MEKLTDTCSITLPRNLNLKDKNIRELITQGMKVHVELGYDDTNECVFEGYVKRVQPGAPVVIDCEDEMYRLKKITVANKNYENLNLADFLKEYMPSDIPVKIADVRIGKLRIEKEPSLAQVLNKFRDEYFLQFFFRDGVFYGVLSSLKAAMDGILTHKIRFRWNTAGDNLQMKTTDDLKLIVKAKAVMKDNSILEAQEPKDETEGNVMTFFSDSAETEADLRAFAKETIAAYKPERSTGTITLFGIPYIRHGDHVTLNDDSNKERNNITYLVKSVRRTFGMQGYRQEIELGIKIS